MSKFGNQIAAVLGGIAYALLSGCANDPKTFVSSGTLVASTTAQGQASITAAKVDFHFNNYYSLTSPNPVNRCAGDAITYYDPINYAPGEALAPLPLPTSTAEPTITIQPAFIKNVSVDLSDSNSLISTNAAYSCSYGSSVTAPPASNCSTFDYGAAAGIYSNMSGSVLMVGGISGVNSAGIGAAPGVGGMGASLDCGALSTNIGNVCNPSVYALAINTLPASTATDPPNPLAPGLTAATGPISTWANLSASSSYAGPAGIAGGAAAFDPGTRRLLIFGGVSATGGVSSIPGVTTTTGLPVTNTWIYDFNAQDWSLATFSASVDNAQIVQTDITLGVTTNLAKSVGGRALFGYSAMPGAAFSALSTNGAVAAANIDKTDRLVIMGGYDVAGVGSDTHRLNPTFGPELVDALTDTAAFGDASPIRQFIDPYYVQLMNNTSAASLFSPAYPAGGGPDFAIGFGMVALEDAGTLSGNLITMGGFNQAVAVNVPTAAGGTFLVGHANNPADTGDFISISDTTPQDGSTALEPAQWTSIAGGTAVPFYGGVSMLPGVVTANDVVYFGGSNLRDYLTSTAVPDNANPGLYFKALSPAGVRGANAVPASTAMGGVVPTGAGMAVAHGIEGTNQIDVAWGGMRGQVPAFDPTIYYLYNAGGTPTWKSTVPAGASPTYYANSALVFSHVTGSFYLFGGYNPIGGTTSADTWQLSFGPAGCAANGTCTFTWRQLNVAGGLSCTPVCPTARRSHRMAEVNYFNRSPGIDPACNNGTTPCSFGIFMEGGTPDGTNYLGDRWMFDPTASGGNGAWMRTFDMPARSLAAIAAADYTVASTNQVVHRAVLFGGETAMENPLASIPGNFYVPPTLGDTWIFDFDTLAWNRADLLGQGYTGAQPAGLTGLQLGSTFNAATASAQLRELSPPAVSGAVMVTRTNGPNGPLTIPETYLIGGRTKDGNYLPFDHVYKFCIGTAAENTADATCVDYDLSIPHTLLASSNYTGRWFRKAPATLTMSNGAVESPADEAAYLGTGTYDPVNDRIVYYGGITPQTGTNAAAFAVTDATHRSFSPYIYEYTAPTTSADNGSWLQVAACAGNPAPTTSFYGHTMSYDSLNHQLVIVGGYNLTGAPNLTANNEPAVWSAKRRANGGNTFCYAWNPITLFGNVLTIASEAPPTGGIAHAASLYVPAEGYNTGYYMTDDQSCVKAGPIAVTDPTVNKLYAGGVYFDLDRTQLGPNENLVLNLTYLPMGQSMESQTGTPLLAGDEAIFRVHLVRTGDTLAAIQGTPQPRYLSFAATDQFPEIVSSLAVLAPPTGQMRSEQIVIPIASDPTIDRIHIQRYSGTAILVDASLYRLGYK